MHFISTEFVHRDSDHAVNTTPESTLHKVIDNDATSVRRLPAEQRPLPGTSIRSAPETSLTSRSSDLGISNAGRRTQIDRQSSEEKEDVIGPELVSASAAAVPSSMFPSRKVGPAPEPLPKSDSSPLPTTDANDAQHSSPELVGTPRAQMPGIVASPAVNAVVAAMSATGSAPSLAFAPKPTWQKGLRVLVVDDSVRQRRRVFRLLRGHGQNVAMALDGLSAVNMVKESMGLNVDSGEGMADDCREAAGLLDGAGATNTRSFLMPAADPSNLTDVLPTEGAGVGLGLDRLSSKGSDRRILNLGDASGDDMIMQMGTFAKLAPNSSSKSLFEAAKLKPKIPFDMIIMDSIMPRMNGLEASTVVRELGFKGLIVGLAETDADLPAATASVQHFLDSGADRVLFKPLNMADLKLIAQTHFEVGT